MGIEITPHFQIRSRIANFNRSCSRPRFWLNLELRELKARDITDTSVGETDEWRWTFGNLNVSNRPPGLGRNGERAQERGHGSNRSCVHAAFLSKGTRKVNLIQE